MFMKDLNTDIFSLFDQKWGLVTAGTEGDFNAMTISWGGLGTLWGKPVATVYIKPIRYTYEFMEQNDYFTVSFFPDEYHRDLALLGTKSGRDCDKLALTVLTPVYADNFVRYKEARVTLVCRKIYWHDLDRRLIPSDEVEKHYTVEEPHRLYIGEVIDIINA